jgi:alpha-beta hydrolase superfamily lysophospholipase
MIGEQQFITIDDDIEIHAKIYECGAPLWLVITHGVSEYSERHNFLVDLFSGKFNLFFYYLRGHGLISGKRVYVEDFSDYARDLEAILKYLKSRYRMERFVLYGHSMGGLITSDFIKNFSHKDLYPELVYLSSPPVGIGGPVGKVVNNLPSIAFSTAAQLPLSLRLKGLVVQDKLSHDPQVNEDAKNDPLCAHSLHTKLAIELVKASRMVYQGPLNPNCPAFVSVGTGDEIVCPESLIEYFTHTETNFSLKVIPEAYHEIHFEIERFRKPYFDFMKESILSVFK